MPFIQQSQAQKYTPKEIKFSKLYQANIKSRRAVGESVLWKTKEALRNAGYDDPAISKIITQDKPIPVSQMKEIAAVLNRAGVYGFEKNPTFAVKEYLNKERVKAQSIARVRREHILEMSEEDLGQAGVSSLNQKALGPHAGEKPSFLQRQQAKATSLTGSRRIASSLSGKAGGGGFVSAGIPSSLKPKF
ncbi:MAG: hypothetical protein WC668_01690 [Patescibacteria group bacterium]|jgi:hypothetical protein